MPSRKDLSNQRFGRLVAIKDFGSSKDGRLWYCRCDCGNTHSVLGRMLVRGSTKSCGCLRRENAIKIGKSKRLPNGISARNALLSRYKQSASIRNIDFDLSDKIFFSLVTQNCFYCDKEPNQVARSVSAGNYIYNGIDRVDNSKGYIEDNVVTCCGQCNAAKNNFNTYEFKEWIESIVLNWNIFRKTDNAYGKPTGES